VSVDVDSMTPHVAVDVAMGIVQVPCLCPDGLGPYDGKDLNSTRFGHMRTVPILMLLCLVACDNSDCPNQPPTLDWYQSTPEGFEYRYDRCSGGELTFSVENAVSDEEGDPLFYVWYRQAPGEDPVPEIGESKMVLDPCELSSLQYATRLTVVVVVSDHPIEFDKDADPFPVIGDGTTMTVRAWTVELMAECP
jgi:hypothetical protein